jgi:hypothetical protein
MFFFMIYFFSAALFVMERMYLESSCPSQPDADAGYTVRLAIKYGAIYITPQEAAVQHYLIIWLGVGLFSVIFLFALFFEAPTMSGVRRYMQSVKESRRL